MTFRLENSRIKKLILYTRDSKSIPVFAHGAYTDDKGIGYWRNLIEKKLKKENIRKSQLLLKFKIVTDDTEMIVDLMKEKVLPRKIAELMGIHVLKEKK